MGVVVDLTSTVIFSMVGTSATVSAMPGFVALNPELAG
jgi:hypothetical protein